jgi:hypothetical protein
MKYKVEIFILAVSLLLSSFVWHSIYAQEISPLGKLAQDYILRLNEDLNRTNNMVPNKRQNAVVVNLEAVTRDAITESIDTISKTIEDVKKEKERAVEDIKTSVKKDIDTSITDIRKKIEKPAYELQRSIDIERAELFENITRTIESVNPTDPEDVKQDLKSQDKIEKEPGLEHKKIDTLQIEVDDSLEKIKGNLEDESGLPVNFEKSQRDVKETLLRFQRVLNEKKEVIESRQGNLVFMDSDSDGVSDYDEIYIYKTDPEKAKTRGDGKTDGEKISEGINPLSEGEEKINYEDPREDKESFVSDSYRVEKVQLLKENKDKLVFEGVALPNTYVTIYVYSTPIVVTVKTNESGQWSYELEKELENGEHQMYVASVDATGKIVARSNPILFTKTAEAATIGIAGSLDNSISTQNFLKDNFILITLAMLIMIVILGMMFVGNHKNIRSAVAELKGEVNSK